MTSLGYKLKAILRYHNSNEDTRFLIKQMLIYKNMTYIDHREVWTT